MTEVSKPETNSNLVAVPYAGQHKTWTVSH